MLPAETPGETFQPSVLIFCNYLSLLYCFRTIYRTGILYINLFYKVQNVFRNVIAGLCWVDDVLLTGPRGITLCSYSGLVVLWSSSEKLLPSTKSSRNQVAQFMMAF